MIFPILTGSSIILLGVGWAIMRMQALPEIDEGEEGLNNV
jgi:hypothetical protein